MLDILFDNRNKDYGAYRLRKYYPGRLTLSLGIALSSVLFLFFLFGAGNSKSITTKPKDEVVLKELTIPAEKKKIEIIEPKKTVASNAVAAPQKKITNRFEIVRDEKMLIQKMPDNRLLDDFIPSDRDVAGVPGGTKVLQNINTSGGGGNGLPKTDVTEVPLINQDPQFPGGVQAWLQFLNKYLRVPDDLQAGEKKTVLIRFEVSVDGSVTGFQVIQSGGKYYDEEVIRVLRKMPKWKPALQSSQPVAVAFTQPVTFMGLEE
jgi:protein TonB